MRKAAHVLKILVIAAFAITACSWIVMLLWNWLMPAIFVLPRVSFLQALGLLLLSKLLLGGFHRHGGYDKRAWKRKMSERWARMTEEDRARFEAGMRHRRACGFGRRTAADDEHPASASAGGGR
jgi:hypothetical protein